MVEKIKQFAREITLDLKFLRAWQKLFFKNAKRFNVLVVHRRAWKTIVVVVFLIYKAIKNKWMYWYIAPTYKQAKLIAFDFLMKFAQKIPWTEINKSELKVTLFNGSSIILFWADTPDSLRWLDLKWAVFDEYAQQPSNIYWEIIFPMINANWGWVVWIWTPKWKNIFYRLYNKAIKDDKFYVDYLTVDDTGLLDAEQLELARGEMSEEEFNQEYYLSWTASIKWSYYWKQIEEARRENRVRKWLFDSLLPVYTFWDLGVSDAMAIVFCQFVWNEIRIIDYYENSWHWFELYRDLMIWEIEFYERMKKYKYWGHYFPHDIAVRELSTGLSRMETVQDLFWADKCDVVEKLSVMDWINAGRRIFEKIYIDEDNCEIFLDKLASYKAKIDDKNWTVWKPEHDENSHCWDAFRYMAVWYTKAIAPEYSWWIAQPDYSDYL